MAAFDTPWLSHLGAKPTSMSSQAEQGGQLGTTPPDQNTATSYLSGQGPATHAAFSPATLSANTPSRSARRSTILVHQKSPLLLATPPQITRALAYSHPFILPLNTFVGLVTWSTGDPWQSFLLLCAFWAVVLYGDNVVRWAGPVVVGMGLIAGMYGRRYSPLSSSGWTESTRELKEFMTKGTKGTGAATAPAETNGPEAQKKHSRGNSEVTNTKHQKTLDEIVETLKELTARCNTLMEPLLEMTDFLSTQRTPTSATTKPALTAMFMRLLIVTPFWIALTAPPWRVVTTRRVALVAGSLILTWHARVMRVSRAILWRSATVRRLSSAITGLDFGSPSKKGKGPFGAAHASLTTIQQKKESELTKSLRRPSSMNVNHRRSNEAARTAGVKFTFIIYENQRRWVGLGWTNSLFAYERPAWTDEHNNAVPQRDAFELPEVEDGSAMRWRWAPGSKWRVDGVPDEQGIVDYDGEEGKNGWIYYDSKWQNGRRGTDGWGRWTRRRKWFRDAELVEVTDTESVPEVSISTAVEDHEPRPTTSTSALSAKYHAHADRVTSPMRSEPALPLVDSTPAENIRPPTSDSATSKTAVDDSLSVHSTSSKSGWGGFSSLRRRPTGSVDGKSEGRRRRPSEVLSEADEEDYRSGLGIEVETELQRQGKEGGTWGIGDEARMSLE